MCKEAADTDPPRLGQVLAGPNPSVSFSATAEGVAKDRQDVWLTPFVQRLFFPISIVKASNCVIGLSRKATAGNSQTKKIKLRSAV